MTGGRVLATCLALARHVATSNRDKRSGGSPAASDRRVPSPIGTVPRTAPRRSQTSSTRSRRCSFPAGRRVRSLPFIHGFRTSAFNSAVRVRRQAKPLTLQDRCGRWTELHFVSPLEHDAGLLRKTSGAGAPRDRAATASCRHVVVQISVDGLVSEPSAGHARVSLPRATQISDTNTAAHVDDRRLDGVHGSKYLTRGRRRLAVPARFAPPLMRIGCDQPGTRRLAIGDLLARLLRTR